VVSDGLERGGDGFPVDVVIARRAAVAAAGVKMAEQLAGFSNRRTLKFLFDIHVEGVEVELQRSGADRPDEFEALRAGVEEIGRTG